MKKRKVFKHIGFILIQMMFLGNVLAGDNISFDSRKQYGTLSPQIQLGNAVFQTTYRGVCRSNKNYAKIILQNQRRKIGVFVSPFNPLTATMEQIM
ncbi:MAG: hypothetical protein HY810_01395 [Candidatus Omnitrophica bacterium]|nr:hypothetical protein [Candidatus Omnitrophota bacterium]